jgi:hypothetical protein
LLFQGRPQDTHECAAASLARAGGGGGGGGGGKGGGGIGVRGRKEDCGSEWLQAKKGCSESCRAAGLVCPLTKGSLEYDAEKQELISRTAATS